MPLLSLAAAPRPQELLVTETPAAPLENAAFAPSAAARQAPAFSGRLYLQQANLQTRPAIDKPLQQGRDARLLPAVTLEFFTLGDRLVPVQRGEMVREPDGGTPSFWRVIAQVGRVWHEAGDEGWSRAAFPLMLVNDTDNDAHQGVALFLYRGQEVSGLRVQFPQQNAPYLLGRPFLAWGATGMRCEGLPSALMEADRPRAVEELARRLPARPWTALGREASKRLEGFGGPLAPEHRVLVALLRQGTLYYQPAQTPWGEYPYPLEMRFGVRSVTKAIGTPLALLRLAQTYGPWVLSLRIGDYVPGLDPKWQRVRFIDAANMASGVGGTGTLKTQPNEILDGYTEGDYDRWYTAPSRSDKIVQLANWKPYPWEPGTVVRYRDQDFFVVGAALDAFLKSVRGPDADIWRMLSEEVFRPIGIYHAPAVRTREPDGREGTVWFNAGYYPTLDDLAKIALLYQAHGRYQGEQLLHAGLTDDLLSAGSALLKSGDGSLGFVAHRTPHDAAAYYQMGFHFNPYRGSASHRHFVLPTMFGYGENEVTLFPNGLVSLVLGNASSFDPGLQVGSQLGPQTLRAVDRFEPF